MCSERATPLQIDSLPRDIAQLPDSILKQILESEKLLRGLAASLEVSQQFSETVASRLEHQKRLLQESMNMCDEYESISEDIRAKLQQLRAVHDEFVNLETYQYQLLSANFNHGYLKSKFTKSVQRSDARSLDIARQLGSLPKDSVDSDFTRLLRDFKDARKDYHNKKEKLNRWDEDRVSGFV